MDHRRFPTLSDLNLWHKRVLVRADLNVPMREGQISDDSRIRAFIPTLRYILDQHPKQVMVMTHLGRPQEGRCRPEDDIAPIAKHLSSLLRMKIPVVWLGEHSDNQVVCLQNVRIHPGEKTNNKVLAQKYASGFDVFVHDAFGTAHRSEASTDAVAYYVPEVCMGLLVASELRALSSILESPKRPLLAIVGGAKVSSKLSVLQSLARKIDTLIVGGGIANTFLKASGVSVGVSLVENDLLDAARVLLNTPLNCPLPVDVVCTKTFDQNAQAYTREIAYLEADDMILDIGPETIKSYASHITQAKTIIWNGPLGVFEWPSFAHGTRGVGQAIAASPAYTVAGGGETLAAIHKFGLDKHIAYQSTGGGAFLKYLEGKKLPMIDMFTHVTKK